MVAPTDVPSRITTMSDCYARQAMVSAIDVKVEKGKGGKVVISRGEFNSEGFLLEGLNAAVSPGNSGGGHRTGASHHRRNSLPNGARLLRED